METPTFKVELKLEDLKSRVENILEQEIKQYFNRSNVDDVLRESIHNVFQTSWTNSRVSKIREIIEDSIDNHVRNSIWDILQKSEIKQSLENSIAEALKDDIFIKELAKATTFGMLAKPNGNN